MSIQNVGKGRWTLFETVSERERPIQSSPRHAEALPTNRAASQPRYRERCGAVGEHMRRKNNLALTRFGEGGRGRERERWRKRERAIEKEGEGDRQFASGNFLPIFRFFGGCRRHFCPGKRGEGRGAAPSTRYEGAEPTK